VYEPDFVDMGLLRNVGGLLTWIKKIIIKFSSEIDSNLNEMSVWCLKQAGTH